MNQAQRVPSDWRGQAAVEAAGGVVLRGPAETAEPGEAPGTCEVLVVHRVRYDDWSLPKGKLDPGESHAVAAVREVEEETGVRATVLHELHPVVYQVPDGWKRVRWFAMDRLDGDPDDRTADREVDIARWVPTHQAADLLTYPADVDLLTEALARRRGGGAP